MTIEFIDLQTQRRRLGDGIDAAIARVLEHGRFVMGPEVAELESQLSRFTGASHVVACASGTDALLLPLLALGVGVGDAVLVPAFTFAATAEVVALTGATPVFVDCRLEDATIEPALVETAVDAARAAGLHPVGVIPVDLYGQPADYAALGGVVEAAGLWMLADAAQSLGATADDRRVGTFGLATATSFFPSKPLGCYGDGGAIFTDDGDLAEVLRSLVNHGAGSHRYEHVRVGVNGRLDTIQAAVLLEKLRIFPEELVARQDVAARYGDRLQAHVEVPRIRPNVTSAWAQYTIRVDHRDRIADSLTVAGVPTAIHYPHPLNEQPAYRQHPVAGGGAPNADRLAASVLSLPMHPYLDIETQDVIAAAIARAVVEAAA